MTASAPVSLYFKSVFGLAYLGMCSVYYIGIFVPVVKNHPTQGAIFGAAYGLLIVWRPVFVEWPAARLSELVSALLSLGPAVHRVLRRALAKVSPVVTILDYPAAVAFGALLGMIFGKFVYEVFTTNSTVVALAVVIPAYYGVRAYLTRFA